MKQTGAGAFIRAYRGNTPLFYGTALLGLMVFVLLLSFVIPTAPAYSVVGSERLQPPSFKHWFGTDQLGRDCFTRVVLASRAAFAIGSCSVLFGGLLGATLGMVAGWYGGWVDIVLVRILDAMKAIPSILLALMIVSVFGNNMLVTIVAISILAVPLYARMARSSTMQIKNLDYMQWTRLIGISTPRILFHHILPNIMAPLIVTASLGFANAVLTEAGLAYLGLGLPPPAPSWGQMLSESQNHLLNAPWLALTNIGVLIVLVLGFNLLGDGLQRVLQTHVD